MTEYSVIRVKSDNSLTFGDKSYQCALGKGGVVTEKKEGDGATPVGRFALRHLYFRADRLPKPDCVLRRLPIQADYGWCDDPNKEEYNQFVTLPFEGSHELLARDDNIYDIIVVLGHNDDPPVPGKGSAIFFHLAREGYKPTEGCVALNLPDMLEVLRQITGDTVMDISL